MTKTITVEQIITDYAGRIAAAVGIELAADDRTPDGFPAFLNLAASRLSGIDQTADWLTEAADELAAYNRLGGDDDKSRALLQGVDSTLYEATEDLELSQ